MTREQRMRALLEKWANMFEGWKTMGGDAEGNPIRRAECGGQAQAYSMCIADLRAALAPESGDDAPPPENLCACGEVMLLGVSEGIYRHTKTECRSVNSAPTPSSPSSAQGGGWCFCGKFLWSLGAPSFTDKFETTHTKDECCGPAEPSSAQGAPCYLCAGSGTTAILSLSTMTVSGKTACSECGGDGRAYPLGEGAP